MARQTQISHKINKIPKKTKLHLGIRTWGLRCGGGGGGRGQTWGLTDHSNWVTATYLRGTVCPGKDYVANMCVHHLRSRLDRSHTGLHSRYRDTERLCKGRHRLLLLLLLMRSSRRMKWYGMGLDCMVWYRMEWVQMRWDVCVCAIRGTLFIIINTDRQEQTATKDC